MWCEGILQVGPTPKERSVSGGVFCGRESACLELKCEKQTAVKNVLGLSPSHTLIETSDDEEEEEPTSRFLTKISVFGKV